MTPGEALSVLGLGPDSTWDEVRRAYRTQIRLHHPDRAGSSTDAMAVRVIEAFGVLQQMRASPTGWGPAVDSFPSGSTDSRPPSATRHRSDHGYTEPGPNESPGSPWAIPLAPQGPPPFERIDGDTLRFDAHADETFRWLLEAAQDLGAITYLDRSGPLFEVLCRFLDEPATSLLVTLQGRSDGTDAMCAAESIEARPGPPTSAVVDVYESVLRRLARDSQHRSRPQGPNG